KTAPTCIHLSGSFGIGVVVCAGIPARGRHFSDAAFAVCEQFPKLLGIRSSRKPAGLTDNRDRLRTGPLERFQPCLRLLERKEGALRRRQTGDSFGEVRHRSRSSSEAFRTNLAISASRASGDRLSISSSVCRHIGSPPLSSDSSPLEAGWSRRRSSCAIA